MPATEAGRLAFLCRLQARGEAVTGDLPAALALMQHEQLLAASGDLRAVSENLDDALRVASQKRPFGRQEFHFGDFESNIEGDRLKDARETDRKSTRLNSSHLVISYAVFCLKKKNN